MITRREGRRWRLTPVLYWKSLHKTLKNAMWDRSLLDAGESPCMPKSCGQNMIIHALHPNYDNPGVISIASLSNLGEIWIRIINRGTEWKSKLWGSLLPPPVHVVNEISGTTCCLRSFPGVVGSKDVVYIYIYIYGYCSGNVSNKTDGRRDLLLGAVYAGA